VIALHQARAQLEIRFGRPRRPTLSAVYTCRTSTFATPFKGEQQRKLSPINTGVLRDPVVRGDLDSSVLARAVEVIE
jgi:hypothetical protein